MFLRLGHLPFVGDIISLLHGLSSKLDVLTATVSDNSTAINNIDVRLTAKIDNLETSMADNINKVKAEMESRFLEFSTDVNHRLNSISAATHSSCLDNTIATQHITTKLESTQIANESRFNKLERELLRNELILTGVPSLHGEVVDSIIGEICNVLQCCINAGDVIASYRLPPTKASSGRNHRQRISSPIILKLGSDWAKQQLLSAYFKKKNLNTGDLGYESKSRIYLNESLTMHNRSIFKAATVAKKSKRINKCYTRNGIVHIQLSEEGRIFRINDIDQLNAIISPHSSKQHSSGLATASNLVQNSSSSSQATPPIDIPPSQPTTTSGSMPSSDTSLSSISSHVTTAASRVIHPSDTTTIPGVTTAMRNGDTMDRH